MSEGNIEQIGDQISELTLLQTADLIKYLEDKLGVTAAAPVAVAAAGAPGLLAAETPKRRLNSLLSSLMLAQKRSK